MRDWRATNGETYIMEGSKDICKILYPINEEEDFEEFDKVTKLILNAPKMEEVLKSILNHIESDLINLESSGYLEKEIKQALNLI